MPRISSFVAGVAASLMLLALSFSPPAFGAFHLEYAKGVERKPGAVRIAAAAPSYGGGLDANDSGDSGGPDRPRYLRLSSGFDAQPQEGGKRESSQVSGACNTGPGTPPASILRRENPMNSPTQYNLAGSSASGCWQITRGTWAGYGGYTNAADAPVSVQNEKAAQLWAGGSGCGHWAATGGCG